MIQPALPACTFRGLFTGIFRWSGRSWCLIGGSQSEGRGRRVWAWWDKLVNKSRADRRLNQAALSGSFPEAAAGEKRAAFVSPDGPTLFFSSGWVLDSFGVLEAVSGHLALWGVRGPSGSRCEKLRATEAAVGWGSRKQGLHYCCTSCSTGTHTQWAPLSWPGTTVTVPGPRRTIGPLPDLGSASGNITWCRRTIRPTQTPSLNCPRRRLPKLLLTVA